MSMDATERETTVAYSDADDTIHVYSSIRKDITAMKKKEQFELIEEGKHNGTTPYAHFKIARESFDISKAARYKRQMSEAQRAAQSERMKKMHAKNKENLDE